LKSLSIVASTLATREKGEKVCEAFVKILFTEIEETRTAALPGGAPTAR
jgi:hypothetical protein